MRTIRFTSKFKSDHKREKSGRHSKKLDALLKPILEILVEDGTLPKNVVDHPLNGQWQDCRDCHVKPDLILIYRKPDETTLELVRLGSHSELGL